MIYHKLDGTTSNQFKIGKRGPSISTDGNGQLKVIVPTVDAIDSYEFIIGIDEITGDSHDIPSSKAIIDYIGAEFENQSNFLDLNSLIAQTVAGPVTFSSDVTGEGTIAANVLQSDTTTGMPLFIYSTVKVDNLNAEMISGKTIDDIVTKDLSILDAFIYDDARAPAQDDVVFIYVDNSTSDGLKLDITNVIRPSAFISTDKEIDNIKIGDFLYTDITEGGN